MAGLYQPAALPPSLLAPEVTADRQLEVTATSNQPAIEPAMREHLPVQEDLLTWEPAELQLAEPAAARTTRHLTALPKAAPATSQPTLIDWASSEDDLLSLATA